MTELQERLIALHQKLQEEFWSRWNRSLPFVEELLGDRARWDRARFLGFDEGASIYHNSYVYGDVKVGKNTWIGPLAILDGTGGLKIGSYCSISAGVQICTHDTVEWALTGGAAKHRFAPVSIGNCCFLGSLTVVGMGVRIGEHVLVGAHSFVNRSIPSNSIAVGCPAQVVGQIEILQDRVKFRYTESALEQTDR